MNNKYVFQVKSSIFGVILGERNHVCIFLHMVNGHPFFTQASPPFDLVTTSISRALWVSSSLLLVSLILKSLPVYFISGKT